MCIKHPQPHQTLTLSMIAMLLPENVSLIVTCQIAMQLLSNLSFNSDKSSAKEGRISRYESRLVALLPILYCAIKVSASQAVTRNVESTLMHG